MRQERVQKARAAGAEIMAKAMALHREGRLSALQIAELHAVRLRLEEGLG
jgi:hypothetical protein